MKRQHRRFIFPLLVLTALLTSLPAACHAQLLPPGDFRGKSLAEWGLEYFEWDSATYGGQTRPDTVDGVRFLPIGGADVTVPPGTPLAWSPYFVTGEQYDDGSEDDLVDLGPFLDTMFAETTIRTTLNGSVIFDGSAGDFPERMVVTEFAESFPYVAPEPREPGLNAIGAIWAMGLMAIIDDLPPGEHTIAHNLVLSPNGT